MTLPSPSFHSGESPSPGNALPPDSKTSSRRFSWNDPRPATIFLLFLLYLAGVWIRTESFSARGHRYEDQFWVESAQHFRNVQMVAEGGTIPELDIDLEYPDGLQTRSHTIHGEQAIGLIARHIPFQKISKFASSRTLFGIYLDKWLDPFLAGAYSLAFCFRSIFCPSVHLYLDFLDLPGDSRNNRQSMGRMDGGNSIRVLLWGHIEIPGRHLLSRTCRPSFAGNPLLAFLSSTKTGIASQCRLECFLFTRRPSHLESDRVLLSRSDSIFLSYVSRSRTEPNDLETLDSHHRWSLAGQSAF